MRLGLSIPTFDDPGPRGVVPDEGRGPAASCPTKVEALRIAPVNAGTARSSPCGRPGVTGDPAA